MIPNPSNALSADLLRDPAQLTRHLQSQRAAAGAQEFEASLFATVLEKMEKSLSITGDSSQDAAHDTVAAMGVRAVAQSLAQHHVLGVASMLEHALGIGSEMGKPTTAQITPAADSKNK